MSDRIRQLIYYTFVATIVCSLWTLGWSKSLEQIAEQNYWPARNPELAEQILLDFDLNDEQSDLMTDTPVAEPSLAVTE